jgi:UDP-N-acetylmuramyl pentapeptide synthase
MHRYLTAYHPRFARSLVYMLQASEYRLADYLSWFHRAPDFRRVEQRGHLVFTAKARLLLLIAAALIASQALAVAWLVYLGMITATLVAPIAALSLLLAAPLITAYGLILPLWLGEQIIQKPRAKAIIARAAATLAAHPGTRIAIAGSYGKTSMKELLVTILGAAKTVAATPGNMNTPLGISRFAARLTGHEDVLIIEFGEYHPGDIKAFCQLAQPRLGVITGINEAHLVNFETLEATTANIFALANYLPGQPVYKNGENELTVAEAARRAPDDPLLYTQEGVNGWRVSDVNIGLAHTAFTAKRGRTTIEATSGLLGAHNIGPLVATIDIADRLGLTPAQIETGLAATKPYEHRMQPRHVAGATVIDDTYNGNLDGVRAGLAWLSAATNLGNGRQAPAGTRNASADHAYTPAGHRTSAGDHTATGHGPTTGRRMYITPGLVEQGSRTTAVHQEIGRLLAQTLTRPSDLVVLMRNSTTPHIEQGLREGGYQGQLQIIGTPVTFYTNLDQFVAAGDVVLMQNDWTDNYA